ncbi:oxidoreductase [Actinoplanes utahensis]|uniref:Fe2OG dioxygenase domain-containing protein n=1 Tax=Actinoplanes utahensis TaxID=1869 RepID=A0A0A6UGQ9_ACTUT|nr:2OG-Fe(II) oxygenase family protein [Actinoplanes utahensis]KHD75225.1 hypothetical protein MB27_24375 [Actinoplanes utahensis]GIF28398.1 oxidoreductase [Actinoplanes utahensis]
MAKHAIPIISYDDLVTGSIKPSEVLDTLAENGFFYLSDIERAIPPSLFKSLHETSERYFGLPLEAKMEHYIGDSDNHRGYVPVTEQGSYSDESVRVYEAFDIGYDSDPLPASRSRGFELVGRNRYPTQVPGMAGTLREYYDANFGIARLILQQIAIAAELEAEHFDRWLTRPASQLRLIHYLRNDILVNREDTSMGGHTDYELLTIIHQSSPGLVAYDRASKSWHNMPVFKNTVLVLVGDMLQFLTGGRLQSLLHRVSTTGEERYSFPFFMNLDFETELGVLPFFGHSDEKIVVGHHLLGQLYRDFPYIKQRVDSGRWPVDFEIPASNVFEQV